MANKDDDKPELDAVLQMYKAAEERRGKSVETIWETIKFTTVIIFGLFTATIALLEFFRSLVIIILPIFAISIIIWAILNMRRQYHRFLETITWFNKIERYLRLYEPITEIEKRHFADEYHLVPERFLESEMFKTGEDFIKARLTICGSTMYSHFTWLCIIYLFLALALISIIVFQVVA